MKRKIKEESVTKIMASALQQVIKTWRERVIREREGTATHFVKDTDLMTSQEISDYNKISEYTPYQAGVN